MRTKKITYLALMSALAMVLSFVESQLPAFVAVPGVKIGLANIAVVFALYRFGTREAFLVSLVRVFSVALLFGSVVTLAYSTAGAVLSLLVMLVMKKIDKFGTVGVSVCGGVVHNIAQIGVACLLLETNVVIYYLPFLLLSGVLSGIAIGIASAIVVKRFPFPKEK